MAFVTILKSMKLGKASPFLTAININRSHISTKFTNRNLYNQHEFGNKTILCKSAWNPFWTDSDPRKIHSTSIALAEVKKEPLLNDNRFTWVCEKIVNLALVGALPYGLLYPSEYGDFAMALSTVLHIHWGIEAIVVDYVRPSVVGELFANISHVLVYLFSVLLMYGLSELILHGEGLSNTIRMLWHNT